MKRLLLILAASALPFAASAQEAGKSLAATIDVYVFPSEGQDSTQQSKDESECYKWAENNVGTDPFAMQDKAAADAELTQAQSAAAQQAGAGRGVRGAAGGAAAGALIGEIASDDAGAGAAWGAALGGIRGHRQRREQQAQAQTEVAVSAMGRDADTAEQVDNFKKAFSVCLESKKYMVKY